MKKAWRVAWQRGSPPRVRGKPRRDRLIFGKLRITPARAGKTAGSSATCKSHSDHPRACGENEIGTHYEEVAHGSPPRVRGKRGSESPLSAAVRITPARAGKTRHFRSSGARPLNHPRACGENATLPKSKTYEEGSPPRVRGKPVRRVAAKVGHRITPARAGKTRPSCCRQGRS